MGADELREFAAKIEALRAEIFCGDYSGLSPEAEQNLCLSLDALSSARHHMKIAIYRQMKKE